MLCLIPIGRGLLMGTLTVFAAAQRGLVLVAVIWLLERFAVPFIVAMAFPETQMAPAVAPAVDPTSGE
jgi:hypothetical protein